MNTDQNNTLLTLVPTVIFWGAAYFLFTNGYRKTALTMGAIGLASPLVLAGGGLLYLKNKGYFDKISPRDLTINTPQGYKDTLLMVT